MYHRTNAIVSRLLSIPHEITTEIVAHLAANPSSPLSPKCHPPTNLSLSSSSSRSQSHFDAYSQHKLTPSAVRDLQNLALTHTHLLSFCRSSLFRTLRVHPGMAPMRVRALADLFHRTPHLVREVKELWWTIGVEEYRGKYEWFRWGGEEREVRKAAERLALVATLSAGTRGGRIRKLWVTGCESQRRYDAVQRMRRVASELPSGAAAYYSGLGAPPEAEAEVGFSAVLGTLGSLVDSPALKYMSFVNLAFPGELLRRCVNLGELRLGEDVKVLVPAPARHSDLDVENGSTGRDVDEEWDDGTIWPSYLARPGTSARPHILSLPCQKPGSVHDFGPNVLFEKPWTAFKDSEGGGCNDTLRSDPILDLSNLRSLSCQYPSDEFSAVMHNLSVTGGGKELKEVLLQVSDFEALVDATSNGTFDVPEGRPLDRLALKCTLPASNTLRAPTVLAPGVNQHLPAAIAATPPPTLADRVSQLLTSLATSFSGTRNVDVEFTASLEHGIAIIGDGGLDLVPLAHKLSSATPSLSTPQRLLQSLDVHFSLVPGCYSSYAYLDGSHEDDDGVMSKKVAERHAEALGILKGAGVRLNVGYDVAM